MTEWFAEVDAAALQLAALSWGWRILAALLIFLVGRWIAGRVARLVERGVTRTGRDPMLSGFLRNFTFGLLLAVVLIAALDQLGVPSASLITALGAAGLAIGLALQGSLSNLASGLLLIMARPFRVGDFVEIGGRSGTVDALGLLFTRLASGDNREITIPNREVASGAIINFSTRGTRRIDLVIGIDYAADPRRALELIRAVLADEARILPEPEPKLLVLELGESSVDLGVRPWVASADYWAVRSDLLAQIKRTLEANGVGIPFPQRTVHLAGAGAAAAKPV
jgi:small conductance mechanosensitive channel